MIKATIINHSTSNVFVKGRAYFAKDKTFQLIGADLYNRLEEHEDIEIKMEGFQYNELENLDIEELRLIGEFYEVDNYWLKNKNTLINAINEKIKEDNEEPEIEGDN